MSKSNFIGWNFPIKINSATGKIETTNIKNDVKQSILILLKTNKGERIGHKNYGSNVSSYMFEPISKNLLRDIRYHITSCIRLWEKRAENVVVNIYNTVDDDATLIVSIKYNVVGYDDEEELNYALNLLES